MQSYIALIHKDADSDFGVSFPDVPGCYSAGKTLDEGRAMAQAVIAGLDPAIHPFGKKEFFEDRWMPGSSPGMTR